MEHEKQEEEAEAGNHSGLSTPNFSPPRPEEMGPDAVAVTSVPVTSSAIVATKVRQ